MAMPILPRSTPPAESAPTNTGSPRSMLTHDPAASRQICPAPDPVSAPTSASASALVSPPAQVPDPGLILHPILVSHPPSPSNSETNQINLNYHSFENQPLSTTTATATTTTTTTTTTSTNTTPAIAHPTNLGDHLKPDHPSFQYCRQSSSFSFQTDPKTSKDKDIKRRSSKACDNCRKSKCKCTRAPDANGLIPITQPCQNCLSNGLECTFNGTSRKRGPPKGYIEAIESRLHRLEAFLGGLLENDDPRAQALFSELVGDNEVRELLQNDVKLSAQSASNTKSRKSWKLLDSSHTANASSDHRNRHELTDTQRALWSIHFKEHRFQQSNKSSDLDDDSECEDDLPDRSPPPINVNQHRNRRRRLGSNAHSVPSGCPKLQPRTFTQPSSTATIPHTATATFTLTRPNPSGADASEAFVRLGDDNHLQTSNPDPSPTKQHSPATISELADVVGQLSLDENDEVRYHGRSSGLYLISASQRYKNFFWHFPKPGFWPVAPIQRSHSSLEIFELVNPVEILPNRETMNHLLDFYWAFVHPLMPVLYKPEFLKQFNNLMTNLDKIKQVRPHWTTNQVWSHALSVTAASNDTDLRDSPQPHSPSPPLEQLEPRVSVLEPTHRISVLLLLVIFSISSRYSNRSSHPPVEGQYWNAGDNYMQKAKQILNLDHGNSKLTNCQSLILLAYREIGSGAMGESWLYTGMAIRMAQDMGLFRDVDKWFMPVKRFTYEDKQIRKRLWWACVNMDKYVSTYIGRPMMIFERDYDTAFPSTDEPDEHEQWKGWSPDGHPIDHLRSASQKHYPVSTDVIEEDEELTETEKKDSIISNHLPSTTTGFVPPAEEKSYTISCFSRSASLSVLTSRIVANIYAIRIRVIGQSSETLLSLLDQNLARWYLDLPEQLRYDPQLLPQTPQKLSSGGGVGPHKRALTPHLLTLHAQFYTALILLHRPFIPASHPQVNLNHRPIDSPPSSPSHSICTIAANAITNIAQAYSEVFGLRQAPVFLVYYIFTAAILHVYNAGSTTELAIAAKANLMNCMNCLKEMAPTWTGAVRAWELLVGLVDLCDQDQGDNQQPPHGSSNPNPSKPDSQIHPKKPKERQERGLKRPASTSDTEDHVTPSSSDLMSPPNSSGVSRLKSNAPYEGVKSIRSVSDSGWGAAVSMNGMHDQDTQLFQSGSGTQLGVSNQMGLGRCNKKDLGRFENATPQYPALSQNPTVLSPTEDSHSIIDHGSRLIRDFPRGGTDEVYASRHAALSATALEEMGGLMSPPGHPHEYHYQQSLPTPPPPPQVQHQQQEQQQLRSTLNQGLSPLLFDLNNLTSNAGCIHPQRTSNDPGMSTKTILEIFGLGTSAPEPPSNFSQGVMKPQQHEMAYGNLDGGGQFGPERERHNQEKMRTGPCIVSDEIFSSSGLDWFASPIDLAGGYVVDPSCQIFVDPPPHPPPHPINHPNHSNPILLAHPLQNYYNHSINRTHNYKSNVPNPDGNSNT